MTEGAAVGEVCVVGSVNLDLMTNVGRLPHPGETLLGMPVGRFPGGKGLNQAVAARRSGAATRLCGAVGDDAEGSFLRKVATQAGVDTTHLATLPGEPSGVAFVFALPGSENSIVVVPGANAALPPQRIGAAAEGARVVLVQLEIPVEVAAAALDEARKAGAVTILNAAPATPDATELLSRVDVLVVNEAEAASLGGPERCLALGAGSVVVTRGARGCDLHRPTMASMAFNAFTIAAVDSTGAGDAFCGAMAAALATGTDLPSAIRRAAAAGAITAGALGAQTDRLSVESIDRLVGAPDVS